MTDQLHEDLARALVDMLASAHPNSVEHPTMYAAWQTGIAAIDRYREAKEGEEDVEYHFLKFDEIIMPGDEVFSPHDKKWILSNNIGMRCGMISLDYRRPIRK